MSKGKLAKFAEMETFPNVFQYPFSVISHEPFAMQGHWRDAYFHNSNPIILELGCGKGEYTVGLPASIRTSTSWVSTSREPACTPVPSRHWKKDCPT